MENCTKFGQLILGKIIKIVATSCQISRIKCRGGEGKGGEGRAGGICAVVNFL